MICKFYEINKHIEKVNFYLFYGENDGQKLELDAAKLEQQAKIAQDKIDSNEDIAQLRANVNLDKQKQ